MAEEESIMLRRQGAYIRRLREEQEKSVRAFADGLDIQPSQLEAIENGTEEAPDKVIKGLPGISNAYDEDMQTFFGARWLRLKEDKGAEAV